MSDPRFDWVLAFVVALRELRPEIGLKMAHTVALSEWPEQRAKAPAAAAKQWAARSAKK